VPPPPPPPPGGKGKPYGPSALFEASTPEPFTYAASESANKPEWLLAAIAEARQKKVAIMPALPCGPHSADKLGYCLSVVNGRPRFDQAKWDAKIAEYNRADVKAAVQQAWRDGVLVGFQIMDEPWVTGGDDGAGVVVGNTWGPEGWMTKAKVDELCRDVKALFPGVPVGTSDHTTEWEPTKDYKVCDLGQFQFSHRFGSITTWRDRALALVKRGGYSATFSFNVINGGTQDRDGRWDCAAQGGTRGDREPNCSMTPAQILTAVRELGDAGCGGLMMWKYDRERFERAAWQQAFREAAALQAQRARRPCPVR